MRTVRVVPDIIKQVTLVPPLSFLSCDAKMKTHSPRLSYKAASATVSTSSFLPASEMLSRQATSLRPSAPEAPEAPEAMFLQQKGAFWHNIADNQKEQTDKVVF